MRSRNLCPVTLGIALGACGGGTIPVPASPEPEIMLPVAVSALADRAASQAPGFSIDPRPLVRDSLLGDRAEQLFAGGDVEFRAQMLQDLGIPHGDYDVALGCVGPGSAEDPVEFSRRCGEIAPTFALSLPIPTGNGGVLYHFLGAAIHRTAAGNIYLEHVDGRWRVNMIRVESHSFIR